MWLILLAAALLFLFQYGCSRQADRAEIREYIKRVETQRTLKDLQFKDSPYSPLARGQLPGFKGLSYFPVDYSYRTEARFIANPEPIAFRIQTSTEEKRLYIKSGRLEFSLHGNKYMLMTYQEAGPGGRSEPDSSLFVPFTDLTTGRECYGGGRYLDIKRPAGDMVIVDFNLAYNPYCAYNHKYSCPLPPQENHLDVAIEAGEKSPLAPD